MTERDQIAELEARVAAVEAIVAKGVSMPSVYIGGKHWKFAPDAHALYERLPDEARRRVAVGLAGFSRPFLAQDDVRVLATVKAG